MPESPGNIEEIHNSLKASLGHGWSDLDQDVVAASKRVLLENIAFQPASAPYSMQRDALRAKYISLNPGPMNGLGWVGDMAQQHYQQQPQGVKPESSSSGTEKSGEGLPTPKVILYSEEKVKMEWTRMTRIGAGLVNMGNTCFFNSTLQCLTYTAPLVNYCFTNDHRDKCTKTDFCMMCEIQNHIKSSLDCGGRSIKPHSILQKLRCIAKHMKWGRQEDAHEFLRFVVDHLQQACLNGETKLDRFSKETTVINQIFGGYLRSQVTCLRCHAKSNTFDPFMDLSLDIKGVNTVEEALEKFVKPETLENENAYKCPKCKNKVRAQKRFSIQKAPNVLTIQLNRFDFHRHLSGKINRFIKYPEKINLRSYMSQRQGEPILYHLYGVLVHSGHSSEHGHYYSYVKSPSKTWYCMNDSIVHQAGLNSVFSADAYVLFYARINKTSNGNGSSILNSSMTYGKSPTSPSKNPITGPTLPNPFKQESSSLVNGVHGKPTSELGTPIKRHQPNATAPYSITNGPKILPNATSATALPGAHSKISFPILTPLQKKQQQIQQQNKDDGKHIVLQIKHGNSTTMEKSPDGKSKVVNGGISKPKQFELVPYNDDSDSEQENTASLGDYNSETARDTMARTSQQYVQHALTSLQAGGDFHHNQLSVKKLNILTTNGSGDSQDIITTKSGSQLAVSDPAHLYKDSQASSCSAHNHTATSTSGSVSKPGHMSSLHVKHSSESVLPNTPLKDFEHRNSSPPPSSSSSASAAPKSRENNRDCHVVKTAAAAGKSGIVAMELPVVNISSSEFSSAKVKATGGNWVVQAQDCVPSPRGSCSSSNSVNSSTEWTVESKDSPAVSKSMAAKTLEPDNSQLMKSSDLLKTTSAYDDRMTTNSSRLTGVVEMTKEKDLQGSKSSRHTTPESSDYSSVTKSTSILQSARPVTPVDISDKQPLLHSPSSSILSDNGKQKWKKHKKKSKKDVDGWQYQKLRMDTSSLSDSSSSKKKKKHKHKKDRQERKKHKQRNDSDTDSSSHEVHVTKHKKHKYSHLKSSDTSGSSDEDSHRQRRKAKDEDDVLEGYEWVEKTIETTAIKNSNKKSSSQVSIQLWNSHVKDDLAPRRDNSSERMKTTWDGSRSSKASLCLEGASHTFGSSVLSWDGSKNYNDREVEDEENNKGKRCWSDEYNQEIDAGKVKKIKKHTSDRHLSPSNPFQNYFNEKQRDEHKEMWPSWSQDHSYHQTQNDHSHKKSSQHQWREKNRDHHSYNKHTTGRFKPYLSHRSRAY